MPIDRPGLHADISDDDYHADPCVEPSLSSSVARVLIDQSPMHAKEEHPRLNPAWQPRDEETNRARDIGSAAHAMMLGRGRQVAMLDFKDYRKDAAKQARDEARAAGAIPLLKPDAEDARAMVDAGRRQLAQTDFAGIFDDGEAELTMVWQEGPTWCRGRLDYLPAIVRQGGHVIVPDYKTTQGSAHEDDYVRTMQDQGYPVQAAFYERGLRALIPGIRSLEFVFVVQEQYPPYALNCIGIDGEAIERAAADVDIAIRLWRHCIETGHWPGYGPELKRMGMPAWRAERSELRNLVLLDRLSRWQAPLHTKGKAA